MAGFPGPPAVVLRRRATARPALRGLCSDTDGGFSRPQPQAPWISPQSREAPPGVHPGHGYSSGGARTTRGAKVNKIKCLTGRRGPGLCLFYPCVSGFWVGFFIIQKHGPPEKSPQQPQKLFPSSEGYAETQTAGFPGPQL